MIISGLLRFEHSLVLPTAATVRIQVIDATEADAPSRVVAQVEYPASQLTWPALTVPFRLEADLADPRRAYRLRGHVNLDGSGPPDRGDHVSTQSYPLNEDGTFPGAYLNVHPIGP
jgi:hypothetical protein